jgi:mono/diheme cytochrome c family protein
VTGRGVGAAVVAVVAAIGAIVGWGTASTEEATRAVAGDSLSGATLFRTKGCSSCHNGPETEAIVGIGPDLSDAPSWAGDRRPGMSAEDYVAESVRTPGAFISPAFEPIGGPTEAMPLLDVSDAELDALVSYLMGS